MKSSCQKLMPSIQVLASVSAVGESPDQNVHPAADLAEVTEVFIDAINPAQQLTGRLGHVLVASEDSAALHGLEQPHHAYIRTVM